MNPVVVKLLQEILKRGQSGLGGIGKGVQKIDDFIQRHLDPNLGGNPFKAAPVLGGMAYGKSKLQDYRSQQMMDPRRTMGQSQHGRDMYMSEARNPISQLLSSFPIDDGAFRRRWVNYPSVFAGEKIDNDDRIREIFMKNEGYDPETNINYGDTSYDTAEEASAAAEQMSGNIRQFNAGDLVKALLQR